MKRLFFTSTVIAMLMTSNTYGANTDPVYVGTYKHAVFGITTKTQYQYVSEATKSIISVEIKKKKIVYNFLYVPLPEKSKTNSEGVSEVEFAAEALRLANKNILVPIRKIKNVYYKKDGKYYFKAIKVYL